MDGNPWRVVRGSDPHALSIVDGTGPFDGHGPHYSRRTPGSQTFTGVGRQVVLVTDHAVWSVVLQRVPAPRGSGASRGRAGVTAPTAEVWRNNMFRRLGGDHMASDLIRWAVDATREAWVATYGAPPDLRLRTEIDTRRVRSTNPGYCYRVAGWTPDPRGLIRGKLYLYAPEAT